MRYSMLAVLVGSLLAATASAQEAPLPDELTTTTTTGPSTGLLTPHGLAVTAGAGGTDFYSKDTVDLLDDAIGGFAELRIAYGTETYIGAEGAYWISGRAIDEKYAEGGADTPQLMGYGGEILARGSFPMRSGRLHYGPFAVAGLGWGTFGSTVQNADDETEFVDRDKVGTIPFGAGFAVNWTALYGEARVMSRQVYDVDGLKDARGDDADLGAWYAGLSLGATF